VGPTTRAATTIFISFYLISRQNSLAIRRVRRYHYLFSLSVNQVSAQKAVTEGSSDGKTNRRNTARPQREAVHDAYDTAHDVRESARTFLEPTFTIARKPMTSMKPRTREEQQ
jgi:hypothetical protein